MRMSHKQAVGAIALILTASTSFWAQEPSSSPQKTLTYCVVGTGQTHIFSDRGQLLKAPKPGEPFFGQDAFYQRPKPSYRDNGDGTISDLNTGLMWVQARGRESPVERRRRGASPNCRVGGHADWRMPTIKELYSLINFNGGFHPEGNSTPYLDTKYFRFVYGDQSRGERAIDCQDWSATEYVSTTMNGNPTVFGVNFADGRIKGYPKQRRGTRRHDDAQAVRPLRPRQSRLRQKRLPRQRRRHHHRPRHGPDVVQGRQQNGHELGGRAGVGPGEERREIPRPQRLAAAQRQGTSEHR